MISSPPTVNGGWYAQAHDPSVHETSAAMRTALIVEDDQSIARLIRDYLDRAGYGVVIAGDAESGLSRTRTDKPDVIVLDLGLPGRDGIEMLRELRRISNVPVVILSLIHI